MAVFNSLIIKQLNKRVRIYIIFQPLLSYYQQDKLANNPYLGFNKIIFHLIVTSKNRILQV